MSQYSLSPLSLSAFHRIWPKEGERECLNILNIKYYEPLKASHPQMFTRYLSWMLELIDLSLLGRCGAGEQSEQSAPLTAGVETAQSTLRSSASNNHQSTAGALAGQTWEKQLTMWRDTTTLTMLKWTVVTKPETFRKRIVVSNPWLIFLVYNYARSKDFFVLFCWCW